MKLTQEELLEILGEVLAGQAYTQLKEIVEHYFEFCCTEGGG